MLSDVSEGGIAVSITKHVKEATESLQNLSREPEEDRDKETATDPAEPPAAASYTNSLGMQFVLIEAGVFRMGSSKGYIEESPSHEVAITDPFYLSVTPVTQEQWEMVMRTNPGKFEGRDLPVEMVSWDEAQSFIERLNNNERCQDCYRLPTEAEWEYAARAGSAAEYSFGDDQSLAADYAWYSKNSSGRTNPVGQKSPNPWGLYDMHGNVSEWVFDKHGVYPSSPVADPSGPTSGSYRVIRGGSWYDDAALLRSAHRSGNAAWSRSDMLGFRLVKKVQ